MSREPERILLIRPSALGDVCRSVPLLVSLRRAFPGAAVDWLVQDGFADAVAHHPDLDEVIPFPRQRFGRDLKRGRPGELIGWLRDLRRRRYGLVVDAQGLARSAFFSAATRAPRRIGYGNAAELGWLGYTERHRIDRGRHAVDRMLGLLEAGGIEPVPDMRLYAPPAEVEAQRIDGRYAVIAPTSRWPGKRWPAERFALLTERLLGTGLERAVIVGAPSERDQIGPVLELAGRDERVVDRVGRTGVGGLMALIASAELVIANDSAAVHMGVGFDRPIVALYGPTHVGLVGPYRRERDVIQHLRPEDMVDHKNELAGRGIMERITVDEVEAAAVERLAQATAAPPGAPA